MALTKIGKEGITGVSNSADATFLTATSGEGVTLAGTLAVTGVHTVGTNAIATSDGGAVTTSIVQGLAKSWMDYKGTDTNAIYDSLNVASVADEGTGRFDPSFTNAMSSANYSITTGAVGGHVLVENAATSQTGKTFLSSGNSTFGAFVDSIVHMQICGDLA